MEHYNIQVSIQKVTETPVDKPKGVSQSISGKERRVIDLAKIAIQAETEAEAYDRVKRIMDATRAPAEVHLHRASCDDSGGNLICGHPAGPTI